MTELMMCGVPIKHPRVRGRRWFVAIERQNRRAVFNLKEHSRRSDRRNEGVPPNICLGLSDYIQAQVESTYYVILQFAAGIVHGDLVKAAPADIEWPIRTWLNNGMPLLTNFM